MLPAFIAAAPGIFSAGKGLWDLAHPQKNPADVANKQLAQTPGMVKPYYDPYINAGRESLETLKNQYGQLTNDPGKRFSELGAGYKESPGYAATLKAALGANTNAAASAGMLGTPAHGESAANVAGDVANKDYEAYINHILNLYGIGLGGNADINRQGQSASESYGNLIGNVNNQMSQNLYSGQTGQNASNAANWNNIIGGAGQAMQGYNNYNQNQELMAWLKSHGSM